MNTSIKQAYLRQKEIGKKHKKRPRIGATTNPLNQTHTCRASSIPHKPQYIKVFVDGKGSRLHVAQDMGFRNPFWARVIANGVADCVKRLEIGSWVSFWVKSYDRGEFGQLLENTLAAKKLKPNGLMVNVRNTSSSSDASDLIVFIEDLGISLMPSLFDEAYGAKALNSEQMISKLRMALGLYLHPGSLKDWDRDGRWSAPSHTMRKLKSLRAINLIEMAKNREDYILCEGLTDGEFTMRLAGYLVAENTVLMDCSNAEKLGLVKKTGLLTDEEHLEVARLLWDVPKQINSEYSEGAYKGIPQNGADYDEEEGRFHITRHKLWVYSEMIDAKSHSAFELVPSVEWQDECLIYD